MILIYYYTRTDLRFFVFVYIKYEVTNLHIAMAWEDLSMPMMHKKGQIFSNLRLFFAILQQNITPLCNYTKIKKYFKQFLSVICFILVAMKYCSDEKL